MNGDGCNQYCQQETGFICNSTGRCTEICGDGIAHVDPCDDGNTVNGDGCSSTCQIEPGWFCVQGKFVGTCYRSFGPMITGYSLAPDDSFLTLYLNDTCLLAYGFDTSVAMKMQIVGS